VKNGDKNLGVKIFSIVLLSLLVISFMGGLFFAYKNSQLPDQCAVNLDKASTVFNGIVTKMDNVVDNFEEISSDLERKDPEVDVTPDVKEVK